MSPPVRRFAIGPLDNNSYLLGPPEGDCLVVDPALGSEAVVDPVVQAGGQVKAVVLTHAHADHILGLPAVLARFPHIPVWVHPDDAAFLVDPVRNGSTMILGRPFVYEGTTRLMDEGDLEVAGIALDVLHVPGHTPGGCALVVDGHCMTGDSLFAGSVGRTDFPGGDSARLLASIRDKLMTLPAETVVLPGHGPESTIGREAASNPFLRWV